MQDDFNVEESYIVKHERLGNIFLDKFDEHHANVSNEEFIKNYNNGEFEEDENFKINLGNGHVVEQSDRNLRDNSKAQDGIHNTNCQEAATDILERSEPEELADNSCCYCEVEMLTSQWHKCVKCKGHVHGAGIGCMNQAEVCRNCQ